MPPLRLVQVNLGKDSKSTKFLSEYLQNSKPHLVTISEPYTYYDRKLGTNRVSFIHNEYSTAAVEIHQFIPKAAILIRKDMKFLIDRELSTVNCAVIVTKEIALVAYYMEPAVTIDGKRTEKEIGPDLKHLKKIIEKYNDRKLFALTDANAKHTAWGNKKNHKRGEEMHELLMDSQLTLLNEPEQGATFTKQVVEQNATEMTTRKSFIDLSIVNGRVNTRTITWKLRDDILHTNHKLIEIQTEQHVRTKKQIVRRIDYRSTDWESYFATFNDLKPKEFDSNEIERVIEQHGAAIEEAAENLKYVKERVCDHLPWYSEKVSELKNEIARVRRKRSTVGGSSGVFERLTDKLRELNRQFKREVREVTRKYFEELHRVENVDQFWKKWKLTKISHNDHIPIFESNISNTLEENLEIIANQFVRPAETKYQPLRLKQNSPAPQTSEEELEQIIMHTSNRKAPGPDNQSNRLIKLIFKNDAEYMVNLFNCILRSGEIPRSWKVGRLVCFTKPGRRLKNVTDLRPITLLNNMLKVGEAVFARAIERELDRLNFFEENQFGFRSGASTIDAI